MGRKSNVNPDHYKTAGRERPGQDVIQEVYKKRYAQAKARRSIGRCDRQAYSGDVASGSRTGQARREEEGDRHPGRSLD